MDEKSKQAICWAIIAACYSPKGQRLRNAAACAFLSPLLPDAAKVMQGVAEKYHQPLNLPAISTPARPALLPSASAPARPALLPSAQKLSLPPGIVEMGKWLRLIKHPCVVLILGKRGSGKSALGYRLLEYLRYTASPYVIGLPKEVRTLLPEWIGMTTSLESVPSKAIVLVDEAYLPYHARSSMAQASVEMSQRINLSRQREQTLIFVSQEARQVDKNIGSGANVVIFKDLGILQLQFDRREFNHLASQAKEAFTTVTGDKRRWSYVYAPNSDFIGLLESSLPTFWRDKLSHIFAAGGEVIPRAPEKTPLDKRIAKAKELRAQGLSLGQIAELLGVTKPTIKNYVEGYPYKRKA